MAGTAARVELRAFWPLASGLEPADPRGYPFRVEAVSPRGKVTRVHVRRASPGLWAGSVRFGIPGRWIVRVANYGPDYRHAPGARPRLSLRVRAARPAPPPAGFGPLGRPGCDPPLPRNAAATTFPGVGEIFGAAVLAGPHPSFTVVATAPDGRAVQPLNVTPHT